jgi:hypothetical protein
LPHRFSAADLFEGAHVDSLSLKERFPQVAELSAEFKKPIREKWAGILNL